LISRFDHFPSCRANGGFFYAFKTALLNVWSLGSACHPGQPTQAKDRNQPGQK
jgi:hypothetical protein